MMGSIGRPASRAGAAGLMLLLGAVPAYPADLPRVPHHHHRRAPAVQHVHTTGALLLPPSRNVCAPGYGFATPSGPCLRHGELAVRCTPAGFCEPLPPDPIPYGIGPYLRLNY